MASVYIYIKSNLILFRINDSFLTKSWFVQENNEILDSKFGVVPNAIGEKVLANSVNQKSYHRGSSGAEAEYEESVIRRTDNAMTKRKRANKHLQNTAQKTKDRATRKPLQTWSQLMYLGSVIDSCSTCDTRRTTVIANPVLSH